MKMGSTLLACILVLAALATWTPNAEAYSTYSVNRDSTNCRGCHGDFRAGSYNSFKDGAPWATGLHDGHRFTMLSGDCSTCHSSPFFPVLLGSSPGGTGFPPISCVGCHGRQEDAGNDSVSAGLGAGLRQHHTNAGVPTCQGCHSDANPANYTPVGENVLPPYYFTPDGAHPAKPTDPCNANGSEGAVAPPTGLDNDGDLLDDGADPDCQAAVCGNGEVEAGEDCDDGNTADGDCCSANCAFEPAGSPCDDGLFCNGIEACDGAGNCSIPGTDPCDDGVGCTQDACDEAADTCSNTPDDALCDDGQFCNGAETCDATLDCQAGTPVDCNDGILCTVDSCNEGTDACDNTPDDALCDDGLFCNGAETCDAANDCQPGTSVDCDDGDICTDDSCNEQSDQCDNIFDPTNDPSCQPEVCGNGVLDPGEDCDDGNTLPGDCCSPTCTFEPAGSACDDGLFCNVGEACDGAGNCGGGTPNACDDGVGCTADSCDEGADACVNTPDDALCDDGLFCNGAETCDATLDCQAGAPVDCDDADICTDDSCNEESDQCDNIFDETNDPSCVQVLDLDIAGFRLTKRVRLTHLKPVSIKLVVKNNGTVDGTANATVVGVLNAVEVYNQTLTVSDPVGNGRTTFLFPAYTPVDAGDIQWTATIADTDPDIDEATATTRVVP
jgi:cysteine-rich repeat protein